MSIEDIKQEQEKWENSIQKTLEKHPERKKFEEKRLYTPTDIENLDYIEDIGFPGEYPYTRGVQPTMYRGRLWTMRQYAGFATAEESNKRYKYLLEQGQTGLSCAFDLPTQIGYDSDDPISEGEVGKVGVAIDSLRDMEILFDGIDLSKVSTSMTINAPASVLLAMYIAVAEKQGNPSTSLSGTIQNDILKEYAARGTYIFPPKPSMRLITDIFAYCSKNVPLWQGRCSVEQRTCLKGICRNTGCTADLSILFGKVRNGQERRDGVDLVHYELYDLICRSTADGIGLGVCEGGGYQRHVAIGPEQFEIEVCTQETKFVREQFHLCHPLVIAGVVLPFGEVGLVDFLQIHAGVCNGRVRFGPCPGIGVGRTPTAVDIVVHGSGLQRILGLVGGTGQEVGAVVLELIVVDLGVNIEYHVLDTFRKVFICPRFIAGVFLCIVEVDT